MKNVCGSISLQRQAGYLWPSLFFILLTSVALICVAHDSLPSSIICKAGITLCLSFGALLVWFLEKFSRTAVSENLFYYWIAEDVAEPHVRGLSATGLKGLRHLVEKFEKAVVIRRSPVTLQMCGPLCIPVAMEKLGYKLVERKDKLVSCSN